MPSMIDVLKEIEPSEVVGQILASPKGQMMLSGAMMTGGTAMASAEEVFRSDVMFYLGVATGVSALLVALTVIVRNLIGINKDLKDSAKKE